MPSKTIPQLPASTTFGTTDLTNIEHDNGDGSFTSQKITGANFATALKGRAVVVSSNYVVLGTEKVIEIDASAGPVTITFGVATNPYWEVQIVKTDNTTNAVSISDGLVVQGVLNMPAAGVQCQSQLVYSNGTALRIV